MTDHNERKQRLEKAMNLGRLKTRAFDLLYKNLGFVEGFLIDSDSLSKEEVESLRKSVRETSEKVEEILEKIQKQD